MSIYNIKKANYTLQVIWPPAYVKLGPTVSMLWRRSSVWDTSWSDIVSFLFVFFWLIKNWKSSILSGLAQQSSAIYDLKRCIGANTRGLIVLWLIKILSCCVKVLRTELKNLFMITSRELTSNRVLKTSGRI